MKSGNRRNAKTNDDDTVITGQWRATLHRRNEADEMPHITPDTVVECPGCGARFRVGKALV